MKLSTKGRYGLRACVDLALHDNEEAVTLCSIAKRQDLSESYLEQLLGKLKRAHLVSSVRGTNGGYHLAKPAKDISVGDILRALEGNMDIVECASDETECSKSGSCVTKYVWKRINDSIHDVVENISLEELLEKGCQNELTPEAQTVTSTGERYCDCRKKFSE